MERHNNPGGSGKEMLFAAVLVAALVGSGSGAATAIQKYTDTGAACKLTLQNDLIPSREPLILDIKQKDISSPKAEKVEELVLALPQVEDKKGVISVQSGNKLLLACLGSNNKNVGSGQQTADLNCQKGKFTINGKAASDQQIACSNSAAKSWVKVTSETCGVGNNEGVTVQMGFLLDSLWFPLVEACHNLEKSSTLYATHEVNGHELKGAVKSNERTKFARGDPQLFYKLDPDALYQKRGQDGAFKELLGNVSTKYLNSKTWLARGHLAPDADMIFNAWAMCTYYFTNAAPQWQTFNAGNWLALENAVRDLAVKENSKLEVTTGTYNVLKLPDDNGNLQEIYLEPRKKVLPVPEVMFKIVRNPETMSCTVAVGYNNVLLTTAPTPICPPAKPAGWPNLTNKLDKGYVHYCEFGSFKKVVTYVPDIECKDLFEFPEKTKKTPK